MTQNLSSRLTSLKNAVNRLMEMAARPKEEATRDSVIKRFEMAFELSWKAMKDYNEDKGLEAANPKDTIRIAADNGVIDDPETWLNFLEARNNAAHIYDEILAEGLYALIKEKFIPKVSDLVLKLSNESSKN